MRNVLAGILAAGLLVSASQAKVSFSLDIELLENDGNVALSDDGLLVLVVDSGDDGFTLPSAGSFGEDVVASWDLATAGQNSSSVTLLTQGGVAYGLDWDLGDDLALLWFPNLDAGETPQASEVYGVFADSNGLTSGDDWEMPADGALLHGLKLFTSGATELVSIGDLPAGVGVAAFTVGGTEPTDAFAPSPLTLVNSGASIDVSWPNNGSGLGYIVQRRKTGSSVWETVGFADSGDTMINDGSGVQPGVNYEYQLLALGGLSAFAGPTLAIQSLRSRIINIAARGFMGDDVVGRRGVGLAVTGTEEMPVLIQAVGPSMGIPNVALPSDTLLTLFYGIKPDSAPSRQIDENDDWDEDAAEGLDILAAQNKYGAFVMQDELGDSALLASVGQIVGGYTSRVVNPLSGGGVSSLQVYDLNYLEDTPADARLTGLASRGRVGVGFETLRGSFIINGEVPMRVIVRANGPKLRDLAPDDLFDETNTLNDPNLTVLRLVAGVWEPYDMNDDWDDRSDGFTKEEINGLAGSVGLTPFDDGSADSIVIGTFDPGTYTAIINGVGGTVGVATVEIYEVPEN